MGNPLKIAHRGASGYTPENSFAAFDLALSQGADAIEFDIQCTADNIPVVFHDETLERITGIAKRIQDLIFDQLQHHQIGDGQRIPSYAAFLERYAGRAILFTEIKTPRAIIPVTELLSNYGRKLGYDQFPVISFVPDWPLAIRARDSNILIGKTSPKESDIPEGFSARAKQKGFWCVTPSIEHLSQTRVAEAQKLGLKVFCWTANSEADIARAKTLGVDGIMSDYPDKL